MFEAAEIDHHIDKDDYENQVKELRNRLLEAQYAMLDRASQAVLVVVAGLEAAGKSETVQLINTWLDARHVQTYGFGDPTDEERERPPLWRYWRVLPPRGKIGVFFDSWYSPAIDARSTGATDPVEFDHRLDDIRRFERMLSDEGFVLLKLWFHLAKRDQRKRLRELEKSKMTRWRVTPSIWARYENYDAITDAAGRALRMTSSDYAPWITVPGKDERYRALTMGQALEDALRNDDVSPSSPEPVIHPVVSLDGRQLVHTLDLTQRVDKSDYENLLAERQNELGQLVHELRGAERALIVVFEGVDAAGKGGAIRRVSAALDPRVCHIVPVAAPTDEERVRPYLWRFWRHIPGFGQVTMFDRSWYGRVLVERVEGFCTTADWLRAYSEINDFEEQLWENKTIVVKLWLHIDAEEQLKRFQDRQASAHKQHKLGPDDWRNREKLPEYEQAVSDLVGRTSTDLAPWTLVEANDKNFARIKVLTTICERVRMSMEG